MSDDEEKLRLINRLVNGIYGPFTHLPKFEHFSQHNKCVEPENSAPYVYMKKLKICFIMCFH